MTVSQQGSEVQFPLLPLAEEISLEGLKIAADAVLGEDEYRCVCVWWWCFN